MMCIARAGHGLDFFGRGGALNPIISLQYSPFPVNPSLWAACIGFTATHTKMGFVMAMLAYFFDVP